MKKSSSSGSIPSANSQRQQSRPVRKPTDRFDEVQERRRLLEEQRQEALKKQIDEKEKRRKRALEIRGKPTYSKQTSVKLSSKKAPDTPSIIVQSASPELAEAHARMKTKPPMIRLGSPEHVGSPKGVGSPRGVGSPTSPLSPKVLKPKADAKKPVSPQKSSPFTKKTSPTCKPPQLKKSQSPSQKKLPSSFRKSKKPQKGTKPPPILELVEPTGSEDSSIADEVAEYSIYYKSTADQHIDTGPSDLLSSENITKETHQRRLTLQQQGPDHSERKASHPNIKFPEKVEFSEKTPVTYQEITSHELERRRKKEYKPKMSATAYFASMRESGSSLEQPVVTYMPTSAPASRVSTPPSSRSNSPRRHMVRKCLHGELS